jgi:hypothetical protein
MATLPTMQRAATLKDLAMPLDGWMLMDMRARSYDRIDCNTYYVDIGIFYRRLRMSIIECIYHVGIDSVVEKSVILKNIWLPLEILIMTIHMMLENDYIL